MTKTVTELDRQVKVALTPANKTKNN